MAKSLVLFVHGLGGDAQGTWGNFPKYLAADPDLGAKVDVAFYDYPTNIVRFFFFRISLRIQDLAASLKTAIDSKYSKYRNVFLVCHSMGGLVCQRYLIDEFHSEREVTVRAIAIYAPPIHGSKLAWWAHLISWKHPHLAQIRKGSDFLHSLREHWPRTQERTGIKVAHIVGGQDKVILRDEAVTGSDIRLIADKGHLDIVKPTSVGDESFVILKKLLLEALSLHNDDTRPPVLFDIYQPIYERHYEQRREDHVLTGNLNWKNLWVFGPSGFGKTVALMRAIYASGEQFKFVSLGHYLGEDAKHIFAALGNNLPAGSDLEPIDAAQSWPNLTAAIVGRLEACSAAGFKWILVEELPLEKQFDFREFFSRLCALLLLYARKNPDRPISLAFSSVADPRAGLEGVDRIAEILKVVRFSEWRSSDLRRLIDRIVTSLNLEIAPSKLEDLFGASKGSPRFIKVFFANYLNMMKYLGSDEANFDSCLRQTQQELFV